MRPRAISWLLLVALLGAAAGTAGCGGPKVKAGNLKEKREKKRAFRDAQERARLEPDAPGGAPPATGEATGATSEAAPAGTEPPPAAGAFAAEDLFGEPFRAILDEDGARRELMLYGPQFGHFERMYRADGTIADREVLEPGLRFQRGTSIVTRKFRKLARLEIVQSEDPTRTGVRVRLHFRKTGKAPEEYPAEELMGAHHPSPPSLIGHSPRGLVRLLLFAPAGDSDPAPLREVEFNPTVGGEPER